MEPKTDNQILEWRSFGQKIERNQINCAAKPMIKTNHAKILTTAHTPNCAHLGFRETKALKTALFPNQELSKEAHNTSGTI